MTSNQHRISLDNTEDDSFQDGESCLTELSSIWDDPHIQCNNNKWRCTWCNTVFNGKNATRALSHVIGSSLYQDNKAVGIGFCKGDIDDDHHKLYQNLASKYNNRRDTKTAAKARHNTIINKRIMNSSSSSIPHKKQKNCHSVALHLCLLQQHPQCPQNCLNSLMKSVLFHRDNRFKHVLSKQQAFCIHPTKSNNWTMQ